MTHLQRNGWSGWLIVSLLSLSMSSTFYAQSQQKPDGPTKSALERIAALLQQSGESYTKVDENIWKIKFKGNVLTEFNVLITCVPGDLLVVLVIIAQKKCK